ncbi:hypothetical protein JXQ70_12355 [bacterium]|nr:hypothetical protein [bacterium]
MRCFKTMLLLVGICVLVGCSKQAPDSVTKPTVPIPTPDPERASLQNQTWELQAENEEYGSEGLTATTYTSSTNQAIVRQVIKNSQGTIVREIITVEGIPRFDITYDDTGAIASIVKSAPSGLSSEVSYYPNGQKKAEWTTQQNGERIGQGWNKAGKLITEDHLDKGKYISAKRWYDNGVLRYEATFKNGRPQLRIFYKPDGTVEKKVRGRR